MRYVRNKYEVWLHNYEKMSGYYVVWECKYEIIMMYICEIDIIFMRYKTKYLRVPMELEAPKLLGLTCSIQLAGSFPRKPSRVLVWVCCHSSALKSGSSGSLLNFL